MPLCLILLCCVSACFANDWPMFRGPEMTGSAPTELRLNADGFGFDLAWKRDLGSGYSSISVVGDIAVTMFADAESDILTAFDVNNGKQRWQFVFGPVYKGHSGSQDGPTSTPTIHDGVVYALDTHGVLAAVKLDDGTELWRHTLGGDLQARVPHYGFSTVPVVHGNLVIVMTGDPEGRSLTALNRLTGEPAWTSGDDSGTYQSPFIWNHDGTTKLLAVTDTKLTAINPTDGSVLWTHEHGVTDNESYGIPVFTDARSFLISNRRGAAMFQLDQSDDGSTTMTELWRNGAFQGNYAIPIEHDGYLYGYKAQFLTCVDPKDGAVKWRSRPPGGRALTLLDGHILTISKDGDLVAVKAAPDDYHEVARIKLFDQNTFTAVSYAAGMLFARNLEHLAAIRLTDTPNQAMIQPATAPEPELMGEFGAWIAKLKTSDDKPAMIESFLSKQSSFPIIEGDLVHYVYRGDVEDIAVARGFEDEKPMGRIQGTNFFYLSERLGKDSHWEYNFSSFGDPMVDPLNPLTLGPDQRVRNELRMPDWPVPDHLKDVDGPSGTLQDLTFASKALEGDIDLKVYLPAGYADSTARYPLVVVTNDQALTIAAMDRSLDNLIGTRVAPVVVAFLPALSGDQVGDQRAAYAEFLAREMVPHLESAFRLQSVPEQRTIMGVGRGAVMSTYVTLKEPGVFGNLATQSFVFLREIGADVRALLDETGMPNSTKAFVEVSSNDYDFPGVKAEVDSRALADTLKSQGVTLKVNNTAGFPSWSSWRGSTGTILHWMHPATPGEEP